MGSDSGLCLFLFLHLFICKPLQKKILLRLTRYLLTLQLQCFALEPNINSLTAVWQS